MVYENKNVIRKSKLSVSVRSDFDISVSIVICCYNSASRLSKTISHILALQHKSIILELIIVDNCSTDFTTDAAQAELSKHPITLDYKIVYEKNPGLNNARKKGLEMATYEWLLFCDDDNWLDEDYLINFKKNLTLFPNLSILGCGISTAVFEKQPEPWFYNQQYLLAVFNFPKSNQEYDICSSLKDESLICGAGMFIKKKLLNAYFADTRFKLLDRKGNQLSSGGDTDLIWFSLLHGMQVGQFANLKLKHYIPSNRITKKYVLKLREGISFSFALLNYKYHKKIKIPSLGSFIYRYLNNLLHLNLLISRLQYAQFVGEQKAYKFLKKIDSSSSHHIQ